MTLNELNNMLQPDNLATIVAEASKEHLHKAMSLEEFHQLRRVCIHLNDDNTAFISLHAKQFHPDKG